MPFIVERSEYMFSLPRERKTVEKGTSPFGTTAAFQVAYKKIIKSDLMTISGLIPLITVNQFCTRHKIISIKKFIFFAQNRGVNEFILHKTCQCGIMKRYHTPGQALNPCSAASERSMNCSLVRSTIKSEEGVADSCNCRKSG
jgi:hypothetical protein